MGSLRPVCPETKSIQSERRYGHFAASLLIVFVLRIVNGWGSAFASGTVE